MAYFSNFFQGLIVISLVISIYAIWLVLYEVDHIDNRTFGWLVHEGHLCDIISAKLADIEGKINDIEIKINELEFILRKDQVVPVVNPIDKDMFTWNPGKITCEINGNAFNVVKKEVE